MRGLDCILCTLGTRGDILPFIAIALALRNRGHRVSILTNENWKPLVEKAGADFHPIAEADIPQSGRDDYQFFLGSTLPSFRLSYDFIAQRVRSGGSPMLLYRVNMLGAQCAAESFGLRNGRVVLQPSVIKSYRRPPWPMTRLAEGRLGWFGRRLIVPAIYGTWEALSKYRKHSDRFRRSVGLASHGPFDAPRRAEDFVLVMCPSWFAMPQSDWPDDTYLVGFPYASQTVPTPALARFIDAHGPPIVFTPGTGVSDGAGFFGRAEEALRLLGRPGVFLSPFAPSPDPRSPPIACLDYADLGWLLSKARALVHHGGIGTTAEAIRAGRPQLVIPGRFDQPDNAVRVATLGLGAAILSSRHSGADWAQMIGKMLASHHIGSQVAVAAHLVATQDAASAAAEVIEAYGARRG